MINKWAGTILYLDTDLPTYSSIREFIHTREQNGAFSCSDVVAYIRDTFFHNDGINFTAHVESITNDVYMTLLEGIVDW